MDRRVEDGKLNRNVPSQVAKLMRRENARNFGNVGRVKKPVLSLRESYCSILEEELELLSEHHWGETLKRKMQKHPKEAWEAFKIWARVNNVKQVLGYEYEDDLLDYFEYWRSQIEAETHQHYESSLYGCLVALINVN